MSGPMRYGPFMRASSEMRSAVPCSWLSSPSCIPRLRSGQRALICASNVARADGEPVAAAVSGPAASQATTRRSIGKRKRSIHPRCRRRRRSSPLSVVPLTLPWLRSTRRSRRLVRSASSAASSPSASPASESPASPASQARGEGSWLPLKASIRPVSALASSPVSHRPRQTPRQPGRHTGRQPRSCHGLTQPPPTTRRRNGL